MTTDAWGASRPVVVTVALSRSAEVAQDIDGATRATPALRTVRHRRDIAWRAGAGRRRDARSTRGPTAASTSARGEPDRRRTLATGRAGARSACRHNGRPSDGAAGRR